MTGEIDWVVPCIGGLHQEFKICRAILDVNWDVCYKAFALSQRYYGEKQLMYIRSGKDHHKTFDDVSRFVDGITDELLHSSCSSNNSLPLFVSGFLEWTRGLER